MGVRVPLDALGELSFGDLLVKSPLQVSTYTHATGDLIKRLIQKSSTPKEWKASGWKGVALSFGDHLSKSPLQVSGTRAAVDLNKWSSKIQRHSTSWKFLRKAEEISSTPVSKKCGVHQWGVVY